MKPLAEERKGYGAMNYRRDALGRPLDLPMLRVPKYLCLDRAGTRLMWMANQAQEAGRPGHDAGDSEEVLSLIRHPEQHMLDQFIGLADATSLRILRFAQRWGPLHICEAHHLPVSHRSDRFLDSPSVMPCRVPVATLGELHLHPLGTGRQPPSPHHDDWRRYWEPLDSWRAFARQARAMLNLAALLRGTAGAARTGRVEDWSALAELGYQRTGAIAPASVATLVERKALLAAAVDTWLQWSAIRPKFEWQDTQPHLRYWPQQEHGLFGTLALQLAFAIGTMKGGLVQCANCHRFFIAQRRPGAGRNAYCPECGKKAADRDAKRRQRERERERRETASNTAAKRTDDREEPSADAR